MNVDKVQAEVEEVLEIASKAVHNKFEIDNEKEAELVVKLAGHIMKARALLILASNTSDIGPAISDLANSV